MNAFLIALTIASSTVSSGCNEARSSVRVAAVPSFSLLPYFRERTWTNAHRVVYRTYVAESTRGFAL